MGLLAPIIAGGVILLVGVVVLIWMNNSQPKLERSTANEAPPIEVETGPSLEDIWHGRAEAPGLPRYKAVYVHQHQE